MAKGRRVIQPEDRAIYWQAVQSGMNYKEAARMAGISYATATKWMAKTRQTQVELDQIKLETGKGSGGNTIARDLTGERTRS